MVGFLIILVISLALYLYGTKKPNHKKVDQNPKANEVILPEIKSENQIPPKPVEREKAGPEREKTDPERKRTEPEREIKKPALKHDYVEYLMKERNVRYLVHFTPVDNLLKILHEGIIPRACQKEKGVWTDIHRLDNMLDCSCLSISYPNYQMFYKKRNEMNKDFAVILIDPYCLNLFSKNDLFFLPLNAASVLYNNNPDRFKGKSALEEMFCDSISVDGKSVKREELHIPACYTTSPQAELLVRGTIPPTYFREIHVMNHEIIDAVRRSSSNSLARIFWNDKYFRARSDYQIWRK